MNRDLLRRRLIVPAVVVLSALLSSPAPADTQDGAVVALHAAPHIGKGHDPCTQNPVTEGLPCRDFTTTWPLNTSCDIYLLVARADPDLGISSVTCGLMYNRGTLDGDGTQNDGVGVDIFDWTLCIYLSFLASGPSGIGEFPASGTTGRFVWDSTVDCQDTEVGADGVHALVGSFYVYAYSDDVLEVIPRFGTLVYPEEFEVRDCSQFITDLFYPRDAGAVAFGAGWPEYERGGGYNPCPADTPVRSLSWSTLKQLYQATENRP